MSKATLKDVAHAAGVAPSTASYAFNGGPKPVSEEVRDRVMRAAERLGYSSNLLARSLVTGRMRVLGILVPEFFSYIATEQVAGVEAEAQEQDYKVVLTNHFAQSDMAEKAQRDMSARRLDGIISVSATADTRPGTVAALPELGLPFVLTYHFPIEGMIADYVTVNQEQGGYIATRHLLERGCQRVAFVGPVDKRNAARERFRGYLRAHAEAGVAVSERHIARTHDYSPIAGREAWEQLLSLDGPHPDAVFSASDNLAAGILRVAIQRRIRVPEDLAVVGFDDHAVLCDGLTPTLTSVHIPLLEVGRWSARRLIERIERPEDWEATTRYLDCKLTIRESA